MKFMPTILRSLPYLYRDGHIRCDVAFVPVSRPDENGYCGLGISNYAWRTIFESARTVIFEINERYPRLQGVEGSHRVHLSEADYVVEGEHEPLPIRTYRAPSETDIAIAKLVVEQIPDGAVLSLGVGGVPYTVAKMLAESDRKDLGCHTGTISDAFLEMYKAGKLTNARKELDNGLSAWNLAMGSQELYDWLDAEPQLFHPGDLDYIHSVERISKLSNVISINGGVQLDLMGQENAESVGTRQLSGIGGQMDFLEGAFRSKGGKGFICINSSRVTKDGQRKSNILATIPGGSTISAPRTMIQYVATEYGIASLSGKTLRERAEAMASIAHPDFREELLVRKADDSAIRIYTTTDPTAHKLFTLLHDPQYRCGVAWQNNCYNQPGWPSFYYGSDMDFANVLPQLTAKPTLWLAGDSIIQSYAPDAAPQTGWGQQLAGCAAGAALCRAGHREDCPFPQEMRYELPGLVIDNCAMAGRSSRSFREEGRLEDIAAHLRPGDFLLVQFAHNDANREKPERYVAPEDFAASLRPYLDAARAHGAICVFASAMAMRVFDGQGVCWPSFPAYRQEMARFAAETNTPYLDLGAASAAACTALGA